MKNTHIKAKKTSLLMSVTKKSNKPVWGKVLFFGLLIVLIGLVCYFNLNGFYRRMYQFLLIQTNSAFIDYDQVRALYKKQGRAVLLLDIRPASQYVKGSVFNESINIPMYENPQEKYQLRDKKIVEKELEVALKGKKIVIVFGDYGQDGIIKATALWLISKGIDARPMNIGFKEWNVFYGTQSTEQDSLLRDVPLLETPK